MFTYWATNPMGESVFGVIEAYDETEALRALDVRSLRVERIRPARTPEAARATESGGAVEVALPPGSNPAEGILPDWALGPEPDTPRKPGATLAFILTLVSGIVLLMSLVGLLSLWLGPTWDATPCRILSHKTAHGDDLVIEYAYTCGRREYRAYQYRTGEVVPRREEAEARTRYPVGGTATC
jgi:hypothetical protein